MRRPFLSPEPGNRWPQTCWPNVPAIGALRGHGNAGGGYSYQPGMPTNWAIYDNGTNAQWDYNFGSHGGEPYFDWRWWDNGTWGNTFAEFGIAASERLAAAQGQVWQIGFYVCWAPGTNTYPSTLGVCFDEYDGSGNWLTTLDTTVFSSPATQVPSDPYRPIRMAGNLTVSQAGTAAIAPLLIAGWGSKTAADECRLRIYRPFCRRAS